MTSCIDDIGFDMGACDLLSQIQAFFKIYGDRVGECRLTNTSESSAGAQFSSKILKTLRIAGNVEIQLGSSEMKRLILNNLFGLILFWAM